MMRFFTLLLIMLCAMASSCRSREDKMQEAQERAQIKLDSIDFSKPDQLPLFNDCGELENASSCFYEKLCEQVELKLADHQLQFEISKADSLTAILKVDQNGTISYQGLSSKPASDKQIAVDSLLSNRLQNMVQIKAALKQGIPVNSTFLLPVIIKPTTVAPFDPSN